MSRILVWDLPTRIFHWLLVAGFVTAFGLAGFAPEESRAFDLHQIIGMALIPLLLFRLVWGLAGTRYARFGSFLSPPGEVLGHLSGMVKPSAPRCVGHNPAAGYAIVAILLLLGVVLVTGLLMPGGSGLSEELHEAAAYALLALVGVHLLGVVLHTVVHRENVILSMITGRKEGEQADGIPSSRPVTALVGLLLVGGWAMALVSNYDPANRYLKIPLTGTAISLSKGEPDGEDPLDDY